MKLWHQSAAAAALLAGLFGAELRAQTPAFYPTAPMAISEPFAAPYAGNPNHAHFAPQFQWGWFGAEHYCPGPRWHRDYTGRAMRWDRIGPVW